MPARPSGERSLRASAPLFAALGDETRLRLVSRLCQEGPLPIVRLAAGSDVTRQAIAKHLRVLEGAGLVRGARQGRESVWEIEPHGLDEARRYLDLVSKRWDAAIDRLKALVER
ncbi:MAG: helix-turn-helix transcriptional regulator [Myxococcales bacterium]|nr:helix-turn-helix transcriptional regulator [Myxococcales bacterium]